MIKSTALMMCLIAGLAIFASPVAVAQDISGRWFHDGKPYTVRYDAVNAMLLNEFLKEHKAFLEERRKVQKLEKRTAVLAAAVEEQAAQIQKVSARVDASRSALQLAISDR